MTSFLSDKIRILSFLAIILVLYIHAGYPDVVYYEKMTVPVVVRSFVADIFGQCAVPLFYVISGYLFFNGVNRFEDVFLKIIRRVKSLLIPFVLAALYYVAFFVLMEFMPGVSSYINHESYIGLFSSLSIPDIFCSLFYDVGNGKPWAFHLWFLRDLIIIVGFTPFIYIIRKSIGLWSIAIVLLLFLVFPRLMFLYGMFWFLLGSLLLVQLDRLSHWAVLLSFPFFLLLSIYHQFFQYDVWKIFEIIEITLGICSIWSIYDLVVSKEFRLTANSLLGHACQFTFFLYLYHEPAFHIIVKGIPMLLGHNEFGYTTSFLLSPIFFAPIGIMIGYLLRKFIPNVYKVLVGGR